MLQDFFFNTTLKIRMKFFFLSLLPLVAGPGLVQGQLRDNIYLVNETSIGNVEIVDVNRKKVKYRNQQGKEFDFKAKEILMTFNGDGRYLAFPANSKQVEEFMAKEDQKPRVDLIVTLSKKVIPGLVNLENNQEIDYHDLAEGVNHKKLPASELAAIIYKDGSHKLFTSPSRASDILNQLKKDVVIARQEYKDPPKSAADNVFSSAYSEGQPEAETAEANAPVNTVSAREEGKKASMEIDAKLYSQKALQKTADLGTYLAIISDRNSGMSEANKAVELAVKLFINEDAQIEVSSKEGRDRYKVRAYLNRLKLLKYDRIEISWTDISYVSDLKKGMDGNYYGIITLQQTFKGFMDNQLVYSDLTEKNVEVKVMAYEKETDGMKEEKWDVFLSDIGVVVTKFNQ